MLFMSCYFTSLLCISYFPCSLLSLTSLQISFIYLILLAFSHYFSLHVFAPLKDLIAAPPSINLFLCFILPLSFLSFLPFSFLIPSFFLPPSFSLSYFPFPFVPLFPLSLSARQISEREAAQVTQEQQVKMSCKVILL